MKTLQPNEKKIDYTRPQIEKIILDNEISLTLLSPPIYESVSPTDEIINAPEYFNEEPF